jgi:large subunit ribosomal protein L10
LPAIAGIYFLSALISRISINQRINMAKTKEQKKEIIEKLKDNLDKEKSMVFIDYRGLKAKDMFSLREELKKQDNLLFVVKKTLMGLVFKEKGIEVKDENLQGQTAIVFGLEDEITPIKSVYDFSRKFEGLKILGGSVGAVQNYEFLETDKMIELAKLPTRDQLLAKLVGTISAPVSGFASVLQGNIRGLVCVLSKIKK